MTTENILLLVLTGLISFVLSYIGAAVGLILGHLRLPILV
jgi:putative Mn2+ efflux pump MntP